MKFWHRLVLYALVLVILLAPGTVFAQIKSGFKIVPCTGKDCKFEDLILTLVRLINFLFAAAAIVAVYHILFSGWKMISSWGNPEQLTGAKESLRHAIIGFSIVLLSFAFINLLLGLFGIDCAWWRDPFCVAP